MLKCDLRKFLHACIYVFIMKISRYHFFIGIFIGLGLVWGIINYWPDGKLHIIFCNVGQGDATYFRFPNGSDMLVDGGPNDRVLSCLGRNMPFYDRTIDLVVLSHPQSDHYAGLASVIQRYNVTYFASTKLSNVNQDYRALLQKVLEKDIPVKLLAKGSNIKFDEVMIQGIWPDKTWIDKSINDLPKTDILGTYDIKSGHIIELADNFDLNLSSLVFILKYQNFDLLMTGDADRRTQLEILKNSSLSFFPQHLEVLKVPHHGSKYGLDDEILDKLRPVLSIIEVGKNSYGHPDQNLINKIKKWGKVKRTDLDGEVHIVTDGINWWIK